MILLKIAQPVPPGERAKFFFRILFAAFTLWIMGISIAGAVELEPYPVDGFSREPYSISFFREERPSFYWVNAGVPDVFFNGVSLISTLPGPIVYSVRTIQYGLNTNVWVTDQLQVRGTIPFEANALIDSNGVTQNLTKFGDAEVAATFLLVGKRESGNFLGLDGRYRFATGTNPFQLAYPLLSTGKGAPTETFGLVMGQELGGFSFFQSIHYEKTQPITLDATNPTFGAGVFQWPDLVHAEGRVEYLVFHRAQRSVSLYYEMRLRMSGLMEFNNQALPYGQGQMTDRLFFSSFGMITRVDKEFSAEGKVTYFPYEPDSGRADHGWLFSISMFFRPI